MVRKCSLHPNPNSVIFVPFLHNAQLCIYGVDCTLYLLQGVVCGIAKRLCVSARLCFNTWYSDKCITQINIHYTELLL